MKKVSAKQYALALHSAAKENTDKDYQKLLANFLALVRLNKAWKQLPKIIGYLEKIEDAEKGILRTEISSAYKLNTSLKKQLTAWLKDKTGKEEILYQEKIDPEIISGLIVKFDDWVVDLSLGTQLQKLNNQLTNH